MQEERASTCTVHNKRKGIKRVKTYSLEDNQQHHSLHHQEEQVIKTMGKGNAGGGGGGVVSTVESLLPKAAITPLPRRPSYTRCLSRANDELKSFRSCLRWMCVDHSDAYHAAISWSLFFLLCLVVPVASRIFMSYSDPTRRAYDLVVQLSLSVVSALSYLCLSAFVRRYGLRRFLFLDKLVNESERVRLNYTAQLNRSFKILSYFVTPCFIAQALYKVFWYSTGQELVTPNSHFLIFGSRAATESVACALELASWIYRTAIFFLVCVLFRLSCFLQILRLDDFAASFQNAPDVGSVLREHLRIRKQLKIISHRYRSFILSILVFVTGSQFVVLFLTTRPGALVNWSNAGDLALCSIGLVTGLLICLRSAAKITHKAQAVTSHAATWHVCATIDSFDDDPEMPLADQGYAASTVYQRAESEDDDDESQSEDELDAAEKLVPAQFNTISFQKRQSLVTYLENNRAGITVFGFVVDRTWLHALFMIEFSLVMWMLGKTIGI